MPGQQGWAPRAAAIAAALLLLGGTAPAAAAVDSPSPSSHTETPEDPHAGHGEATTPTPTPGAETSEDPHAGHDASEHEAVLEEEEAHSDGASTPTRRIVLSGFGVVNTFVIGAAVLLRRSDRRSSGGARRARGSRR